MSGIERARIECENWGIRGISNFRTEPLTCSIAPGEIVALVGRPGSGKSLILERMAGIRRPGIETVGAMSIWQPGLVPQDARLSVLPTDRVWTLLGLNSWAYRSKNLVGYRPEKSSHDQAASVMLERLRLNIDRVAGLHFRDLSGTERRIILLGAALLQRPLETLLIDGWDETMNTHCRRAAVQLLREKVEQGLSVLVSARHYPLRDLPEARSLEFGSEATGGDVAVPLVRKLPLRSEVHRHPLLEVGGLRVKRQQLGIIRRKSPAFPVDGASLFVRRGETMVLLGVEGSGKTTLLEAIAGLSPIHSGVVLIAGHDVTHAKGTRARRFKRDVQLVFQDAATTLDGLRSVQAHLDEAIKLSGNADAHPGEWLETLGLSPRLLNAPADQLSAAEGQRINLIRCLILRAPLILFDSPEVSGADTDGGLINAVITAEKAKGRTFLIATSDAAVAEAFADRIAVLHSGRVIELGTRSEILRSPAHPITKALIDGTVLAPSNPTAPAKGCPHLLHCVRRKLPQCQDEQAVLTPLISKEDLSREAQHGIRRAACYNPLIDGES